LAIEGTHDIDQGEQVLNDCVVYEFTAGWVDTVKIASSNKVKIVPRVMFEGWSMSDYSTLFASRDMALDVAKTIKHTLLVITVICRVS